MSSLPDENDFDHYFNATRRLSAELTELKKLISEMWKPMAELEQGILPKDLQPIRDVLKKGGFIPISFDITKEPEPLTEEQEKKLDTCQRCGKPFVYIEDHEECFGGRVTTDGKPPVPGYETASAPGPIEPATGQHTAYWVLSEEDRKKGWVRPLRRKYKHKKCGVVTSMGLALCETYAKNPAFYSHTFCVGCSDHLPVSEFTWDEDGTEVGS